MDQELTLPEPVERLDLGIARETMRHRDRPAVRALSAFGKLSDQPPLLAAAAAMAAAGWLRGDRRLVRRGAHVFAAVVLATVMKDGLKRAVARTRPTRLEERGQHEMRLGGPDSKAWTSFPSGHAAGAAAMAGALTRCWPEARWPAVAAAAALALSRVPKGSHYPTDVLAGVAVGMVASALAGRLLPPHGGSGGEDGGEGERSGVAGADRVGYDCPHRPLAHRWQSGR